MVEILHIILLHEMAAVILAQRVRSHHQEIQEPVLIQLLADNKLTATVHLLHQEAATAAILLQEAARLVHHTMVAVAEGHPEAVEAEASAAAVAAADLAAVAADVDNHYKNYIIPMSFDLNAMAWVFF
jgi:hypothetical protein